MCRTKPNVRILKAVAERLGLPPEKVMLNLDRLGIRQRLNSIAG